MSEKKIFFTFSGGALRVTKSQNADELGFCEAPKLDIGIWAVSKDKLVQVADFSVSSQDKASQAENIPQGVPSQR